MWKNNYVDIPDGWYIQYVSRQWLLCTCKMENFYECVIKWWLKMFDTLTTSLFFKAILLPKLAWLFNYRKEASLSVLWDMTLWICSLHGKRQFMSVKIDNELSELIQMNLFKSKEQDAVYWLNSFCQFLLRFYTVILLISIKVILTTHISYITSRWRLTSECNYHVTLQRLNSLKCL